METEGFLNKGQTKSSKVCVCNKCCKITLIILGFVMFFLITFAVVIAICAAGPLHAQCKVTWDIGANCSDVQVALIDQMKTWHTKDNCLNGGQRCLYEYSATKGNQIVGTHETPKKHYIDDLSFTLIDNGERCTVNGKSRSRIWYAILDYGTNYCNIHNLVEGARLNETKGYTEDTNEGICTQYETADCDVY